MATTVQFTDCCYLFCIWIISTFAVRFIIRSFTNSTKFRSPPSPAALPFIGHLHLLSSTLPKSLETLAKRCGPLMQIRMGDAAFIIVSDANTAEEVLKTHDADFASKYEPGPAQQLIYRGSSFVNSPYGPYWRFIKKLCITKLFAGSQLDRFTHIREQERMKLLKFLVQRSIEGESCDLSMELEAFTNHMMYRMAMGKRCTSQAYSDQAVEIRRIIRDIMECGSKFPVIEVFSPLKKLDLFGNGKRIKDAFLRYDQKLEQIIQEYEDNRMNVGDREEKDVMDILLETYKDTNAEIKLTKNHIKYFFMEIFMAAVDTTATTLQSAMAELINRPHVFKKLREEINSVVGYNRLITESDVPNLPYLQAVLKETLRLHPPGPLLRRTCAVDKKINGYDVKAGIDVVTGYTGALAHSLVCFPIIRFDPFNA
ncbi:putative Cytochrome P450 [Melia azedarach]|uniref:Cytochrome P450 n=1 Tax=Melia azedarach TaxID=155640 RepID=A0ACC1X584_MELAZ|nr:putative Cytochrome P450 [Melia azedarach]